MADEMIQKIREYKPFNEQEERDREVLELRFVREWKIRDIARRLSISETAARKRVDRARARLVAVLRREGYDEYGN